MVDRRSERAFLDELAADVSGGTSRAVVLRGEAGVGKTALLGYLTHRCAHWSVATVVGVESEIELPYSGLQQLCAPFLSGLERLPSPQRNALGTVFGLVERPFPNGALVGLATLSLLAEAGEHRPVLCVVDDAHWLDRASANVVAFVARRLQADRIGIVGAARTGIGDGVLAVLPTLSVDTLPDADARELLLASLHGPLDEAVCQRVIEESKGNPLALLELSREWAAAKLAYGYGLPDGRSMTSTIEQSYARRILALPAATRLLLLTAASEPTGDPTLLIRALQRLDIEIAGVAPAVDRGLVRIRRRVEFVHPMARSAAYLVAVEHDRRLAHRALADATDAARDPDRRAWHLARAAAGPEEATAAELERSSIRARSRGGLMAAAAFLTRACELTPDPRRRVERALDAAAAHVRAGTFGTAEAMLSLATSGNLERVQLAHVALVRAKVALSSRRGSEATALLLTAAEGLRPFDPVLARDTYLDAFGAAMLTQDGETDAELVVRSLRAAPRVPGCATTPVDLLLEAHVALREGGTGAAAACRAAVAGLRQASIPEGDLRWLWHGCVIALAVLDDVGANALTSRYVAASREAGAMGELTFAVRLRVTCLGHFGELPAAAALAAEVAAVEEALGTETVPYSALQVAAWRGDEDEGRRLFAVAAETAAARGQRLGVAVSQACLALLCNGLARYDEALEAAYAASQLHQPVVELSGLHELVEAAVRTGKTDVAEAAVERLTSITRGSGSDWAVGIEARARALLATGAAAEDPYREAVEHFGRTLVRPELARTHLLYGEWLRREGRRVDARAQLRTAHDLMAGMGMQAFAERARRELVATGERVRKRVQETRAQLTPQELQVARLAVEGLSNAEIGGRLFLSGRTVEWHLRKVFTKLDIVSRAQLHATLPLDNRLTGP
jgi:DNA-binding CsgD family transcriptional regulator